MKSNIWNYITRIMLSINIILMIMLYIEINNNPIFKSDNNNIILL